MASRVMELVLKGDSKSMSRTFQKAQGDLNTFSQKVQRVSAAASKALTGVAVAGGAAAVGLAADLVRAGDQFDKMSKRTGVSVEQLQRLKFAAEQSGAGIDTVEKALKRSAKFLADADRGLATYTRQLDELGLTVEDFKGLSPDEAFNKFADAIAGVEDPIRKAALAQEIFGRQGNMLLPLLNEGSVGIKALGDQMAATGNIMSAETAAKSAELVDALNELKQVGLGVARDTLTGLLPAFISVTEFIKNNVVPVVQWAIDNWEKAGLAIGVFALAVGAIPVALVALGSALVVAWHKFETFRDVVAGVFRFLATAIGTYIKIQLDSLASLLEGIGWIADKFTWLPGPVGDAMGSVAEALDDAGSTLRGWGDNVVDAMDSAADWVDDFAERGETAILGFVDEGTRALARYQTAVETTTSAVRVNAESQRAAWESYTESFLLYTSHQIEAAAASAQAQEFARTRNLIALRLLANEYEASYQQGVRTGEKIVANRRAVAQAVASTSTQMTEKVLSESEQLAKGLFVEMRNACGAITGFKQCVDGVVVNFDKNMQIIDDDATRMAAGLAIPITNACGTVTGFKQCVDGAVVEFDENMNRIVSAADRMAGGVGRAMSRAGSSFAASGGWYAQATQEYRQYWFGAGMPGASEQFRARHAAGDPDYQLASGGIVTRPIRALIGESGPEAVIPLRRGMGAGGGITIENLNVEGSVLTTGDLIEEIIEGLELAAERGELTFGR